ncbi:MAG: uroporphyrinogen-III synthase [Prevotella sp.]|nr:uroporphyrinogen-III synthase [Prevotella sp.]
MIKKILVSQPRPTTDKSPYYDIEKKYGVECVFRPFFKVEGVTAKDFRQQRINPLNFSAVIFTSRHAIDNFFSICKEMRITIPETMKYFCPIETIALYIQKYVQYRKRKVFFGTTGKPDDLVPLIQKHKTDKYLVPLSSVNNGDIKALLDKCGVFHKECTMYSTVSNDFSDEEKQKFNYDMLLFFSPTGVKALKKNFPAFEQGDIRIGAFGAATAKTVAQEGLRLDFKAPSDKYPSMTSALDAYLKVRANERTSPPDTERKS